MSLYLIGFIFILIIGFIAIKFISSKQSESEERGYDELQEEDVNLAEETVEGDHIALNLKEGVHLLSYGYDFQLDSRETEEKINATDEVFAYTLYKEEEPIGQLEVVIREIDNEDQYVFTRFNRTTKDSASIPLKIVFEGEEDYSFYQFEEELEQEHDRVFGIDHTSNVKGLYSIGEQYELFLAQNYISNELTTVYDNGQESVLRELVNEDKNLDIQTDNGALTFALELRTTEQDQISESWFLLSGEPLFSSEEAMEKYKKQTNHDFISSRKWLTSTGPYTKLPWSIEPSTKLGYGRNLVVVQGMPFIKNYNVQPERFYYDMIVNSINYVWDFKDDTDLWETEYTSTWLKNDYGIIAPYTDTRHNENISLFLSRAGEILNNQELKDSYLLYADFLVNQEESGNILRTDNGYYILDYYSEAQTKKTHVSLNHALGEMSYLFDAYRETKEDKYLQVALKIKQAVEDTGEEWINPNNGDLWYQINGDYTFEGKDYDTLTLYDLVVSVGYYEEFDLPYGEVYHTLMDSKIDFIIADEVGLEKPLYNQLIELGFEEKLEGYAHVIDFKE